MKVEERPEDDDTLRKTSGYGSIDDEAATVTSTETDYASLMRLSNDELMELFLQAEHYVAVVHSRLHRDPMVVNPKMWDFQTRTNLLWAYKQQALLGSCEALRGTKEYAAVLEEERKYSNGRSEANTWLCRPCCFRMVGDSKMKLWQELGYMAKEEAQRRYIALVTEIAPDWQSPGGADTAFLRTWTPDHERDQCSICEENFTFLNRRHHCRRCLSLVCAVCSPYAIPLRAFTQAPTKRQRVCVSCYNELQQLSSAFEDEYSDIQPMESDDGQVRPPSLPFAVGDKLSREGLVGAVAKAPPVSPTTALTKLEREQHAAEKAAASSASGTSLMLGAPSTIHSGLLEFFHGAGFRKSWHEYFFVLLIRKGSLGMFLNANDHLEKKKRPAAVYKLSGYTIRVKSQKRRPHQFRLSHPTKKLLHFSATSIEDMNAWISAMTRAIDIANELEASQNAAGTSRRSSISPPASPRRQKSMTGDAMSNSTPEHEFATDAEAEQLASPTGVEAEI